MDILFKQLRDVKQDGLEKVSPDLETLELRHQELLAIETDQKEADVSGSGSAFHAIYNKLELAWKPMPRMLAEVIAKLEETNLKLSKNPEETSQPKDNGAMNYGIPGLKVDVVNRVIMRNNKELPFSGKKCCGIFLSRHVQRVLTGTQCVTW